MGSQRRPKLPLKSGVQRESQDRARIDMRIKRH